MTDNESSIDHETLEQILTALQNVIDALVMLHGVYARALHPECVTYSPSHSAKVIVDGNTWPPRSWGWDEPTEDAAWDNL